jgi:hypothetical protein
MWLAQRPGGLRPPLHAERQELLAWCLHACLPACMRARMRASWVCAVPADSIMCCCWLCAQDMNGIIHPCFHPEDRVRRQQLLGAQRCRASCTPAVQQQRSSLGIPCVPATRPCTKNQNPRCVAHQLTTRPPPPPPHTHTHQRRPQPAPTSEVEVFRNIFDYIDRLFAIVRPRRLLYLAIGECCSCAAGPCSGRCAGVLRRQLHRWCVCMCVRLAVLPAAVSMPPHAPRPVVCGVLATAAASHAPLRHHHRRHGAARQDEPAALASLQGGAGPGGEGAARGCALRWRRCPALAPPLLARAGAVQHTVHACTCAAAVASAQRTHVH